MSAGEVITGILGGVGTVGVLYALRLMRRMAGDLTREVKAIVAAPAEVKELRTTVQQLGSTVATNTTAIGHLSSALDRLATLAEKRINGG